MGLTSLHSRGAEEWQQAQCARSTLPDKWHILACHMEAALVVFRQVEHLSSHITNIVCVSASGARGYMVFFIIAGHNAWPAIADMNYLNP